MNLFNLIFEKLSVNTEAKVLSQVLAEKSSHKEVLEFCSSRFPLIGEGFSRKVFDAGEGIVIKIAATEFNTNQNKREIELKETCHADKYFTKIFSYDLVGFIWLIAEKLKPVASEEEFREIILTKLKGIDSEVFRAIQINKNPSDTFIGVVVEVMNKDNDFQVNRWLADFCEVLNSCKIDPSDFTPENWGTRSNGELVVLDYGL